ncbi:MAG: phage protease [Gammaproteobacteria bacterium]
MHLLSGRVALAEGQQRSTETILRVVRFDDPFYGLVDITADKLRAMVRNFEANVYGQDLAIDVSHQTAEGAAGFIRRLSFDGRRLLGEIEWTPWGVEQVVRKGFRYFSAEFEENWKNPETGQRHGPVLFGAAITVRPRVKKLDPIKPEALQLSFDNDDRGYVASPYFRTLLTEEITTMWDKLIIALTEKLKSLKLAEDLVTQIIAKARIALAAVTEEAQATALISVFEDAGEAVARQLADLGGAGGAVLRLDFSGMPQFSPGLGADEVKRLMAEWQTEQAEGQRKLAERLGANVTRFTELLEASETVKKLSEGSRAKLLAAKDLVTADMTEDQVKRLAEHQIQLANDLSVAYELSARGWPGPAGAPHITVDETNNIKALQEAVDRRLGLVDLSAARRFANVGGALRDENRKLAEAVLATFDRDRGAQLQAEHRMLAGGDGIVSDVAVPVVWERTVIREALYNLVALQFLDAGTDQFATSYMIPYSYRDTTAAGRDNTRRYEGQAVARAGVIQTADTAYNIPQKLAFEVSDELRYLTAARHLNWEAVGENQRNATRIIGEDLDRLAFNEILHAADEYGATAVSNENLELQADGTKNIFILAQFPVVRPRKVYDLQGNQVGSTVNPVTVTYNSNPVLEYDGTGTQANGTYYVLDYNLGEIRLVNQAGAIQVPADATAYTISYSYATNVYKFDTDLGSAAIDAHWDTFLYRYGLRKAVIEDQRFHMANYGLMSGTVMTMIEQAKQFGANARRAGTDLAADGNLGRIKDVPNYKTSAPGLWMGDQRIIVAERGVTRMRITKPWTLGELENQKDGNGRFTGKKEAYGDQFLVMHTPNPLKRAATSIVLFSTTARVARAA